MNDLTPEMLFEQNVKLAYHICNKCCNKLPEFYVIKNKQDLIQQALLGLWKACCKYDANKLNEFSTYAGVCIKRSVLNYAEQHFRWRRGDDQFKTVYLDDEIEDGITFADLIEAPEKNDISWIFTDDRLTSLEKHVCILKYEGYTDQEIADKLGYCRAYPNKILKQIGRKLKDD